MKILTINYGDITQIGGVNFSIKRVMEGLVEKGHECYVVGINPGNLLNEENINGVNIIRIKSPMSKHLYGLSPGMAKFLSKNLGKSLKPDIIHVHGYRSLLTLEVACILRGKRLPFVFSPHYHPLDYKTFGGKHLIRWYRPIASWIFKWAQQTVSNSEWSANLLRKDFGISGDKIQIIYHGVDYLEFPEGKRRKVKDTSISLLYVGFLMEYKGVQYIIEALSELRKRGRHVSLTIVGKGDYEDELKKLSKKLRVQGSISWVGPLSRQKLHRKFMEGDIFLLLSRSESFGIVVAEALAAGTPCIVTKTTALTEFLTEPGCFGIDYPPDPQELANLIIKIHDNEIKVGPFSNIIRTWDKVAQDYETLYKCIFRI